MNRATRRTLMHQMRADGCTCTPDIVEDERPQPVEVLVAGRISHDPDCPLGDRWRVFNRVGLLPMLVHTAKPGCTR